MPTHHQLSHAQQALWFLHELAPASSAYHTGVALAVRSALDTAALAEAVAATVRRHPMADSAFIRHEGHPVRLHAAPVPPGLEVREVPGADDAELHRAVRDALNEPFDLETRGAFRFVLLRRTPTDAVLLVAGHHIGTDATSNWLLLRDVVHAHGRIAAGDSAGLAPVPGDYDAYVAKEAKLLASSRGDRLAAQWHARCDGAVPAEIPTDRPRTPHRSGVGATHTIDLDAPQVARLREAARTCGVTLFSYLLGTFQGLLHRYTRQNDFLVGCPTTTRMAPALREVVGNFINTLVFRAEFGPTTTFREAAVAADAQVRAGIAGVGYPFSTLTRTANRPRSSSGSSLCQITFNMIGTAAPDPLMRLLLDSESGGDAIEYAGLVLAPCPLPQAEGQLDLSVNIRQSAETLSVDFRYDVDLFDPDTVRRFAGLFVRAADQSAADPDAPVARLRLMDAAELARLMGFDDDTYDDDADDTDAYEEVARRV
ncbi:condensation domain-containing protein [Streptomyces sp. BA2]|uniref:condensation domain-containing protein n=1 Tax=Streptomyces sp. BA2 TaxID=436595 RepID=UPI00136E7EC0|nr:condensation domain-containing protein [Streptomyces sp. BA2]